MRKMEDLYVYELIEALQDENVFIRKFRELESVRYEAWTFYENSFVLNVDRNASFKARAIRNKRKAREIARTYKAFIPLNTALWYLNEYLKMLLPKYVFDTPEIIARNVGVGHHISFKTERGFDAYLQCMPDENICVTYYVKTTKCSGSEDIIDISGNIHEETKRIAMKMFRFAYLNTIMPVSRDRKKLEILEFLEDNGFTVVSTDIGHYGEDIFMSDSYIYANIRIVYRGCTAGDSVDIRMDAETDSYWKRFRSARTQTIRKELKTALKTLYERRNQKPPHRIYKR